MTDRLIPDPATARTNLRFATLIVGRLAQGNPWFNPRNWLDVEAAAIQADNAVALHYAGERPRGTETRGIPLP